MGYLLPASLPPIEVLVPMVLILGGAAVVTILAAVSIMRSRRLRKEIFELPMAQWMVSVLAKKSQIYSDR